MRQAIHIFKKDVRYLRFEICLVVVLAGTLPGLALPWPWAIAAAFRIARVIHAEAIPGDNQFWITRPYRRTSLMAAKLLFIGAFINLPFFLVQLYLLIHYEHLSTATWPGLLWSQVLMVLCLSLPAAALAAMTPGMVAYGLLELIVAAAVYSLGQFSPTSSRIPWPSGVEWISNSLMISMAALAAILILTLQFHRRKTWTSRAVALVATLVCVSIFQFLPPQFALNAETHLTRPSIETKSLKLSGTPDSIRVNMVTQYGRSSKPQLILPVEITGVPTDVDIKVDSFSGTFQGSGGRTSTVFTNGADIKVDSSGKWIANATFFVDPAFYRTQRDETVTLHASLY
jgi:hypothetical protein